MDHQFWHKKWGAGEIGFHQNNINELLVRWWPEISRGSNPDIFVPLCGKSKDLFWLYQHGCSVIGNELSPIALHDFFLQHSLDPVETAQDKFTLFSYEKIRLLCGDFFDLQTHHLENTELIYDRAALIALPTDLRQRYVNHMINIIPAKANIFLITLDYDQSEMSGPPFSVTAQEVEHLFANHFSIKMLQSDQVIKDNDALANRGLTQLNETAFLLTRI